VAVREVLRYPDPRLKQVCAPAAAGEAPVDDLIDTMRSFGRCVGIAAPQVGALVRVCVVDCTGHPKVPEPHGLLVLVNPVVRWASEETAVGREGCLSIPDLTGAVRRPQRVRVAAEGLEVEASGFEARVLLHELDHLDGLLFLDRASQVFPRRSYA
jgi:peptide deformylase